jgi:adenylate cyclase
VLGDTVNLASRLQDLTKFYHVDILTNDGTQAGQESFIWCPVDRVAVKGRRSALTIYQPLCDKSEATPELYEELSAYQSALNDYYSKQWDEANAKFKALIEKYPKTYLYRIYLERIAEYKLTPPPEDWSGVYTHTHK